MSKIERSTGRKARNALEKIVIAGGSGTILIGIAEDSKLAAVAGTAVLASWAGLKLTNQRPEKAEKLFECTVSGEGYFGTETPSGTTTFDIQGSSLSQPSLSVTQKEDNDSADEASQEPEYPVGSHLSSERMDTAETLEALERILGPSFDDDIGDIRVEANLYHGTPDWDINIDTYNEVAQALEELEDSGALPQSTQDNIDSMQARLGIDHKDVGTDESNDDFDDDNDSEDSGDEDSEGDYGDGGDGDGGDSGDGGGE
ncbi:MAG: hypothetical protein HYT11_03180 [Candidatus Levybacteria bacterium]|nr:hypothetical protein [Candidatus Levybacteria bacterium]